MNEEKMIILRMLKEGKINEDEASKLLDAIYNKDKSEDNSKTNFKSNNKDWQKDFDNTINKLENGLNKFGEKFGEKMDKIGKEINEDSDSFADKIMSSFNSFIDKDLNDILGRYEIKKETLELEIDDIENLQLDIKGINGDININPWSKDYIYVEAICHIKKNKISKENQIISVKKLDNTVLLNPLFESNIAVKLDISLPAKKYENIILNTTNGKINILDLNCNDIKAFTKNASINLYDINSDNINLSTKNGAVNINNANSEKISANTTNGKIKINNINSNIDLNLPNLIYDY
ncbi:MAG: DUF4097 family beta strand repeat-containing protein, partial [Senegalia sp. (in: firmicutes)]